nr:Toll-like receptor 4 [Arenicola marina]
MADMFPILLIFLASGAIGELLGTRTDIYGHGNISFTSLPSVANNGSDVNLVRSGVSRMAEKASASQKSEVDQASDSLTPPVMSISSRVSSIGSRSSAPDVPTEQKIRLCPAECVCNSQQGDVIARCQGGRADDVIRNLPVETTNLTYTVETFSETNVSFRHLAHLVSLVLTSDDLWGYGNSDVITRGDLFGGLERLRQLGIHIHLRTLNASFISPLRSLKSLDLSHTRSLDKSNVVDILNAIRTFNVSLTHLKVRNFQRRSQMSSSAVINIRDDIVRHLEGVPLLELDIGDNGITVLNPCFIEFLPSLQVFGNLGNEGRNDRPYWLCATIDMSFHPSIRSAATGTYDSQPSTHRSRRDAILSYADIFSARKNPCYRTEAWKPYRHLPDAHPACQLIACMCWNYTHIPCKYIPKLKEFLNLDRPECDTDIIFPVTPKLEGFQMVNERSPILGNVVAAGENVTVCWKKPNTVRYIAMWFTGAVPAYPYTFPVLKGLINVTYLNIQGNRAVLRLGAIAKELPILSHFLAGGNTIELNGSGEAPAFTHNPNLQSLDLANCGLSNLSRLGLGELLHLHTLNLSRNLLRDFDVDIGRLANLRLLNVSQNRLTRLHANVTSALDALSGHHHVTADLSGNPLICGCDDLDFVAWLITTRVELPSNDNLMCIHPTLGMISVASIVLQDLKDVCFPTYWRLILLTALTTSGVLGLILGIIGIYRKRWSIRFYIHAASQSWQRRTRMREEADGRIYPYDAFIVYSSEDRGWVHDVLVKTLEDQYGLRLCIHFRDFRPGRNVEDTIVESIDKSRKTVLVMSPNFFESEWCRFEFNMARQKIVDEGLDVLILLILEPFPRSGLSRTMVRLLEKKTYIEWTEDDVGKQLFWNKLVSAVRDDLEDDPEP